MLPLKVTPKSGPAEWTAAVYQYDGDLFGGVYVYSTTQAKAVTAARRVAGRLAPKLSTGGGSVASV